MDTPPIHVLHVLATRSLAAGGAPSDPVELTAPTDEVVPSASIRLRFDRFLLPSTISRQAMCLRPNMDEVSDYTKCSGGVFVQPSYDPVRREIVIRQEAGARLKLATLYTLTLFRATLEGDCTVDNPTSCGVLGFDRAPLEAPFTVSFHTADNNDASALDEGPPPIDYCGDNGVAKALGSCAYSRCHAPGGEIGPAEGLSFYKIQALPGDASSDDPTALNSTAVNRAAHQTQVGESASKVEETPARFGRAMPLIDAFDLNKAGSPGNSYLIYKLLARGTVPGASDDLQPSAEEVKRLRDSVVVGMPMPPEGTSLPLTQEQLLALSNWIEQGAPTRVLTPQKVQPCQ